MYQKVKNHISARVSGGRRYELFVKQKLQAEGWEVYDSGRNGVFDHGIDLIASKDGVTRYIQCKDWKRTGHIHEDVVSHLYGSVAMEEGPDNLRGVEMYIYSPAQLDSYAAAGAEKLGIHIEHLDHAKWNYKSRRYRPYWKRKSYNPSKNY